MKVKKFILTTVVLATILTACESSSANNIPESNSKTVNNEAPVVEDDKIIEEPKQTEEEIFIESLNGLNIKFTTIPKITNIKRAFNTGYTIEVKQNDVPAAGYAITVEYPVSKTIDGIQFEKLDVTTDENGLYVFTPATPAFAAATKVSAYPTPLNDAEEVLEAVANYKAEADWKVKSDIITKGAVLFIWDYNEKNRPVNNSYDILSEFRTRGMSLVGNAPVNETSYIGKPISTLYKENYEIIEDAYGYLIVGTVKFTKPVEPVESGDGYLCSLVAEIQAVNMKNGATVFTSTFEHEATGKNWNACVSKCKDELSVKIVDALVYGL